MPRRLALPAALSALPLLLGLGGVLSTGALLSACDTAVECEAGTLQVEDIGEPGGGPTATVTDSVHVAYTASVLGGALFYQTEGETLLLSDTIEGFQQGVEGMHEGDRRRITIPPNLGYGEVGTGAVPPCATLLFDVTLLEIR